MTRKVVGKLGESKKRPRAKVSSCLLAFNAAVCFQNFRDSVLFHPGIQHAFYLQRFPEASEKEILSRRQLVHLTDCIIKGIK